jgi:SAM-dependent methyltransferase
MSDPADQTSGAGVRTLFTLTIFLSAGLLFLVQPLYGRMALPLLGGAPAVWATALVFFQTALLAGYAYAHAGSRLSVRTQVLVHAGLLLAAGLTLPITLSAETAQLDPAQPVISLLMVMVLTVGLPFAALAAHAPLIQRWFAHTSDRQAHDPYFLYAASNLGSILGLLAYPLLLEPLLPVDTQSLLWTGLYAALVVLVLGCGWVAARSAGPALPVAEAAPAPLPGWRDQLRWLALAAVPSGLLVSTSTVISTDIAAMPLLWVPPLLLYLLSFVIGFAAKPLLRHTSLLWLAPFLIVVGAAFIFLPTKSGSLPVFLALTLLLFTISLACHGELYALRPAARHLTRFYLLVSLGGALGGGLTALAAPLLFNWLWEYPLLVACGAFLVSAAVARRLPRRPASGLMGLLSGDRARWVGHAIVIVAALLISYLIAFGPPLETVWMRVAVLMPLITGLILLAYLSRAVPIRFAWVTLACALAFGGWNQVMRSQDLVLRDRSFFGVITVRDDDAVNARLLVHGTTVHGAQSLDPKFNTTPLTYYMAGSGLGQVLRAQSATASIGLVGLGAGASVCHAKPGQAWTLYEIDPLMIDIARNPALFSYVSSCTPSARMVLGDARLKLAEEPVGAFDVLAVDAFSSDAIPLHLMTREAFDLYKRVLKPEGVLLAHISNRYLDLEPVVARIAAASGWRALRYAYQPEDQPRGVYATRSVWIAFARTDADLARVGATTDAGWTPLRTKPDQALWTDQYANLLGALKLNR